MQKFREGDVVYCIRKELEGSATDHLCGLDEGMEKACEGFPMTVVHANRGGSGIDSYFLSCDQFGRTKWWFHVDDLDFFNLNLENK